MEKRLLVILSCTLFIGHSLITMAVMSPKQQQIDLVQPLKDALIHDDISGLEAFIHNNSNFQWDETYLNLPWPSESQTPLSAAVWLGSIKCLKYLLKHNIGNIQVSINIPSSRGYTPLHYAQYPPSKKSRNLKKYPHQHDASYKKIAKILKQYHALPVA